MVCSGAPWDQVLARGLSVWVAVMWQKHQRLVFFILPFAPDVPIALCPVFAKGLVYPPARAALHPAP